MRILIVSGSRADYGLLEWPRRRLKEAGHNAYVLMIHGSSTDEAHLAVATELAKSPPDLMLLLGDRFEVLSAAIEAHLHRIPIAHIAGGDVAEGSYDNAMRDCISRLATIHLATSNASAARLKGELGCDNVFMVGNPALDEIMYGDWKGQPCPLWGKYVVISYQPETIDGTNRFQECLDAIEGRYPVFFMPNLDAGSKEIRETITQYVKHGRASCFDYVPHEEFLDIIYHCDEFIGNSSAMLYEAPFMGVKTRMIGNRQGGRWIPSKIPAADNIVKAINDFYHC